MEKKISLKKPFWWFFAAYALSFAFFYCAYLLQEDLRISFSPLEYLRHFYLQALSFGAPLVAGGILVSLGIKGETALAMMKSWILPLSMLVYTIPYYYFYYFYMTIDSLEAILFSLVNTIFDCAVFYAQSIAVYFGIRWLTDVIARKKNVRLSTDGLMREGKPFDLSLPTSLASFIIVGIKFVIMLAMEIFSTVDYLVDFSDSYKIDEIAYMLFSYVFLLAELVFTQYLIFIAKNRVLAAFEATNSDET